MWQNEQETQTELGCLLTVRNKKNKKQTTEQKQQKPQRTTPFISCAHPQTLEGKKKQLVEKGGVRCCVTTPPPTSAQLWKSHLSSPRGLLFLLLCSDFSSSIRAAPALPTSRPSLLLHLLGRADPDVAETLAHGLEQRVAERVHADGVDAADAVDLDQVTLDARHHRPDVYKGQDGEEDSPDQRQGDADQRRQQPVAPVLGNGEGGEAGFPHAVEAVGPCRLGDHILKVYLKTEGGEETEK